MKKVLFVTYYFPPAGGPAVQRVLRFLNALPEFGWQPVVLTVENGDYPVRDETLLAKLPVEAIVHRTYIPEPYRLYRKFTRRKEGEALDLAALSLSQTEKLSFKERVAFWLRNWLFIPDPRAGWLPFALRTGLKLMRDEKIELIFSTAPPNTVHLVALWLKRLSGKKWVADFRDPWFKYLAPKRSSYLPRKIDEKLCKAVVQEADHLIWVCRGVQKEMALATQKGLEEKGTIVTNGYVAASFSGVVEKVPAKFRMTYVGSLFSRYDLRAFVAALEEIALEESNFARDFEMVFCGSVDPEVKELLQKSKVNQNMKFTGYLAHDVIVRKMKSSTLLLLYIIDSFEGKNIPTSKLFEYLGAQRPIFALSPEDSDAAEILRETDAGFIVPPNDAGAIKAKLSEIYHEWQSGTFEHKQVSPEKVAPYESRNLTEKLVRVWDDVLKEE